MDKKVKLPPTIRGLLAVTKKQTGTDYASDVQMELKALLDAEFKRGAIAGAKEMRDSIRQDLTDHVERIEREF